MSSFLDDLISKRTTPTRTTSTTLEAIVHHIDGDFVFFTLEWDESKLFGPAPWNHASAAPPPVGATCVVVFVGDGIGHPWVVAWSPTIPLEW